MMASYQRQWWQAIQDSSQSQPVTASARLFPLLDRYGCIQQLSTHARLRSHRLTCQASSHEIICSDGLCSWRPFRLEIEEGLQQNNAVSCQIESGEDCSRDQPLWTQRRRSKADVRIRALNLAGNPANFPIQRRLIEINSVGLMLMLPREFEGFLDRGWPSCVIKYSFMIVAVDKKSGKCANR